MSSICCASRFLIASSSITDALIGSLYRELSESSAVTTISSIVSSEYKSVAWNKKKIIKKNFIGSSK